ncbi:MAG TPA: type II toxin-antitoxin system VapC family toxin [Chthoniobacterales bacterium]|jgi:predicted nucleic acid-binding protein|nr:type II toxin-antitoxin system VapC family toxin [Chthoniobacterales bacterium]
MDYYADTGFLISLYINETTTVTANSTLQAVTQPLPLIPLGFLELRNALYLAVFRKQIEERIRRAAWQTIERDIHGRIFTRTQLDPDRLHEKAAELADKHSATAGIRTLDLIHVAAAVLLGTRRFLSFDNRQRIVAKREGLEILP